MPHFRTLDVYRCAVALLPIAYSIAELLDGEMSSASSSSLQLECAAVLDAAAAIGLTAPRAAEADVLVVRIVSMLTKMIG